MIAAHTDRTTRQLKLLAAAPVLLLVAIGLLVASGWTPVAPADAVTQNVTVTAQVGAEVHITSSSCDQTAANDVEFGALNTSSGDTQQTLPAATCNIVFGSNNSALGAKLEFNESQVGQFLCIPAACATATGPSTGQFDAVTPNSATLGEGESGMKLTAVASATQDWPIGTWYPVTAAAQQVCHTTSTADGTCTYAFGVDPDPAQQAGTYTGVVHLVATAL